MKIQLFALLFLASACGNAPKKKDAVYTSHTEMSEEEYRKSLSDKKLETPIDPSASSVNPSTPPAANEEEKADVPSDTPEPLPTPTVKKPLGIGVLSTIIETTDKTTSSSTCTATLINGDELITAAHCAPHSPNGPQDYCSKMTFLHANESVPFTCAKVLWSSTSLTTADLTKKDSNTASADILILKLNAAPQNITSYSLNSGMASHTGKLKVFVYTPNEMDTAGFSTTNVLNAFNDFNFAGYTNCIFADSFMGNYPFRSITCPIVEGNSGGPVINSKNKIQGIISGCLNPVDSKCTNGNNGGYMTDVGCLEKVNGKYGWRDSCTKEGAVFLSKPDAETGLANAK